MVRPFNILLSSAGRRVTLLNLFKKATHALCLPGEIIATDASPLAAAWQQADLRYLVPQCDAPEYVDAMMNICRRHEVKLVVPTIDPELSILAANRRRFEAIGTTVLVSSADCIHIAGDKVHTNRWLVDNGFPTVEQTSVPEALANPDAWAPPLIAKPRNGSSSIGVIRAADRSVLEQLMRCTDYIVQTVAAGHEHTVDVLVTRQGHAVCAVPRRRIEVRAGEVSKAVTVRSPAMESLAAAVCERLPGAYGAFNVQMFEADDGTLAIVEINARFGGGFPLASEAGADYPRWILEELVGATSTASAGAWKANVGMLRYDAEFFFDYERADPR
jgi:carbamoyl-phosphate synthase large subunit